MRYNFSSFKCRVVKCGSERNCQLPMLHTVTWGGLSRSMSHMMTTEHAVNSTRAALSKATLRKATLSQPFAEPQCVQFLFCLHNLQSVVWVYTSPYTRPSSHYTLIGCAFHTEASMPHSAHVKYIEVYGELTAFRAIFRSKQRISRCLYDIFHSMTLTSEEACRLNNSLLAFHRLHF